MEKIVIIDDEIWVAEVIKNIIPWKEFGFEIAAVCHDGVEAMEAVREYRPELVLTDIRMPGKTGLDIIREIFQEFPEILCVVISGYNDFEYAKTALTYGAIGYLLKPIDGEELEQIVRKARGMLDYSADRKAADTHIHEAYEQTIVQLREQFFSGCLNGACAKVINRREVNSQLNLHFKVGCYRIVSILEINGCEMTELYSEVNKNFWGQQLPVLCHEIVSFIYQKKILILLNYDQEKGDAVIRGVKSLAETFFSNTSRNITFMIGSEFCDIGKMPEQYGEIAALEYIRLFQGSGRIYECELLSMYSKDASSLFSMNIEVRLKQALQNGNQEEAEQLMKDAYQKMRMRAGNNPAAYTQGVHELTDMLMSYEDTITGEVRNMFAQYLDSLHTAESCEEAGKILQRMIRVIAEGSSHVEERKEKSAVEQIQEYIQKNYMDSITLMDVSEMVHLNANYVSDIFRRETGMSFKEYLTCIRIEAAKELLKKSNYRQAEIAAMTGYNDVKHFAKTFKKNVGISTLEYRKLMREK